MKTIVMIIRVIVETGEKLIVSDSPISAASSPGGSVLQDN